MIRKRKYEPEFKKKVAELYTNGISAKELASIFKVSDVSVRNWAKEFFPKKKNEITELKKINIRLSNLESKNKAFEKSIRGILKLM